MTNMFFWVPLPDLGWLLEPSFSDPPPRHQERACNVVVGTLFPSASYLVACCFVKTGYHYTKICLPVSESRLRPHDDVFDDKYKRPIQMTHMCTKVEVCECLRQNTQPFSCIRWRKDEQSVNMIHACAQSEFVKRLRQSWQRFGKHLKIFLSIHKHFTFVYVVGLYRHLGRI